MTIVMLIVSYQCVQLLTQLMRIVANSSHFLIYSFIQNLFYIQGNDLI